MILILVKWDCCKLSEGGTSRRARGSQGQKTHDASLKRDSQSVVSEPHPQNSSLLTPLKPETEQEDQSPIEDGGWRSTTQHPPDFFTFPLVWGLNTSSDCPEELVEEKPRTRLHAPFLLILPRVQGRLCQAPAAGTLVGVLRWRAGRSCTVQHMAQSQE